MDATNLALTVVGLITPYLAQAGEVVAKKAGEAAWIKMKELYSRVKDGMEGDDYAQQTLKRLEEKPQSETRQQALAGVLEEKMQEDQLSLLEQKGL